MHLFMHLCLRVVKRVPFRRNIAEISNNTKDIYLKAACGIEFTLSTEVWVLQFLKCLG